MADLTINNIIKMILGILILVVVLGGIYFIFNQYIIPYFKGLPGGEAEMILLIIR